MAIKKSNEKKKLKQLKVNRKVNFENFTPPSYEEIIIDIKKKVGGAPPIPKGLSKGKWSKQSLKVLRERYLGKDEKGEVVETPDEMCWRVAWEVASAESRWGKNRKEIKSLAKTFYNVMVDQEFLPNSPTLMNAGTGNGLQYSACFVLPVEDSLVGIFDAIKYQALIHQTGGGTGFSFSRLRPNGSIVSTSQGTASGPVSFMRIFDSATNEIKQGGKRRGANMGILRVDHPDIKEFIHCKDEGGITNFNISVAFTDKFIDAYKSGSAYDLVDPKTKKVVGSLDAREIFDEIAESAWKTGDPGLVFLDRRNEGTSNPVPSLGPIEATNPCGEQELYPYDACNLGSIFLGKFVKEGNGKMEIDWKKLKGVVRTATRFLDNVIEVNPFPLDEIRKTVFAIRRIGLGIGGWADLLVELEIPYDSEEALELAEKVMKTILDESVREDRVLAKERGPFPLWHLSVYKNEEPRRNATVTTIAPTGTISIIANASSGIEPFFAIAYQHIVKDKHLDRKLTFVNPKFKEIAKRRGFWNEEIEKRITEVGVVRGIDGVPKDVRDLFGTAQEINFEWHVKMQAAFQKYTENAVSKTINLPNSATVEDVKNSYLLSWETGCKGITVFRDGSKDVQVLNLGVGDKKKEQVEEVSKVWERPLSVSGSTYKINTPVGMGFITVNEDVAGSPIEVFINIGRAGSDVQAMAEALGRLISKSLKFGKDMNTRDKAIVIIDQLRGIGGRRSVGFGPNKILSLPDAIAFALSIHLGLKTNGNSVEKNGHANGVVNGVSKQKLTDVVMKAENSVEISTGGAEEGNIYQTATTEVHAVGDICPSCGAGTFVYQEGCSKCFSCGHSEC